MNIPNSASLNFVLDWTTWTSRAEWPRVGRDYVFAGEAVHQVGKAMFGDNWSSDDVLAKRPYANPETLPFNHWRKLADQLVPRAPQHVPVSLANYPSASSPRDPLLRSKTREESRKDEMGRLDRVSEKVKSLRQEAVEAWQHNEASHRRLISVLEHITDAGRDGQLETRLILVGGTELLVPEVSIWNQQPPLTGILGTCKFPLYFASSSRTFDCYVFISRASVDKLTATLAHTPVAVASSDIAKLSPYLQFAVKLALDLGYTSEGNADSNLVREAEVRARWEKGMPGVPISESQVAKVAFMLGWPKPESIARGGRSLHKRKTGETP